MFDRPLNERIAAHHRAGRDPAVRVHGRAVRIPRTHRADHARARSGRSAAAARRQFGAGRPPRRPAGRRVSCRPGQEIWEALPRRLHRVRPTRSRATGSAATPASSTSPRTSSAAGSRSGPTRCTRRTRTASGWPRPASAPKGGYTEFEDLAQLRATGQYRVLTPQQLVDELKARRPVRQRDAASDDGRYPAGGGLGEPASHRGRGHPGARRIELAGEIAYRN